MSENSKEENIQPKVKKKYDFEIKGIDIDKNEYQEIILSNSNHPESTYYRGYRD